MLIVFVIAVSILLLGALRLIGLAVFAVAIRIALYPIYLIDCAYKKAVS
jgi:hypothetical protein